MRMADDMDEDRLDGVEVNTEELLSQQHQKLATASFNNEINEVKSLLDGADEETVNSLLSRTLNKCADVCFSGTLLQFAISLGHIDIVEYLVPLEGHDLEHECWDTGTSLVYACLFDSVRSARVLLENGAHPDHFTSTSTPLVTAAQHGSKELVSLLLEYNADVNVGPQGRYTEGVSIAFYIACLRGNLEVVEQFLSEISEVGDRSISQEQLVLCQSILALQLLQDQAHVQIGLSIWKKALELFNLLMKPRFGQLDRVQLSHLLHGLYLRESALVQSGKTIQLNDQTLLKRTKSRFPDFRLCASPNDITDDFHGGHHTVKVHDIILKSCVSVFEAWWSSIGLTLYDSLGSIIVTDLPIEKIRLCLLVMLENALHLGQEVQILLVNCHILLTTVLKRKLYTNNPGFLTLIMDVNIEAVRSTFEIWSNTLMSTSRLQKKSTMDTGYGDTSEVISSLAFLVLWCSPSPSQIDHVTKLIHTYVTLVKQIQLQEPSFCMEFRILSTVLTHMLESDPLELKQHNELPDAKKILMTLTRLLLGCGMNANARDKHGNTVMFSVMSLDEPYRSDMIELLMTHEGHVDITNHSGHSPYTVMCNLLDCRISPLVCRTLKCRAASTVSYCKIPYRDQLPRMLEEFVELHDTHTPTNPFA